MHKLYERSVFDFLHGTAFDNHDDFIISGKSVFISFFLWEVAILERALLSNDRICVQSDFSLSEWDGRGVIFGFPTVRKLTAYCKTAEAFPCKSMIYARKSIG